MKPTIRIQTDRSVRSVQRSGDRYASAYMRGDGCRVEVEIWADGHGSIVTRDEYGQRIAQAAWTPDGTLTTERVR